MHSFPQLLRRPTHLPLTTSWIGFHSSSATRYVIARVYGLTNEVQKRFMIVSCYDETLLVLMGLCLQSLRLATSLRDLMASPMKCRSVS